MKTLFWLILAFDEPFILATKLFYCNSFYIITFLSSLNTLSTFKFSGSSFQLYRILSLLIALSITRCDKPWSEGTKVINFLATSVRLICNTDRNSFWGVAASPTSAFHFKRNWYAFSFQHIASKYFPRHTNIFMYITKYRFHGRVRKNILVWG